MSKARGIADGTFSGDLTVDTNTLVVDGTNNNVGIGSNPTASSKVLVTHSGSNFDAVRVNSDTVTEDTGLYLRTTGTAGISFGSTSSLAFFGGGAGLTERMRIDSSGHVLVGTTDAGIYDDATDQAGHNILANGQYYSSAVSEINMILNKQNSDGDMLQFRKNGVTTGSISTYADRISVGSGICNIAFVPSGLQVIPSSGTANSDNTLDLGAPTVRFKDLYLSGSIYQGYSASGYKPLTTVRHCDNGGGGVIFPTHVANKAQMGTLYAYDTSNNNWCVYALKKNDGGSTISVQLLAGTGLTIVATNSFGTIAMSNDTSAVKMIVQIYVVEN